MSCRDGSCAGQISACAGDEDCDDQDAARGFRTKRPWVRGDTIILEFQLTEPYSRSAPDLGDEGSKVWFTVKDYLSRADLEATWQGTLEGGDVEDLGGGRVRVTIPAVLTANVVNEGITKLYYDIQCKWNSRVWTQERGLFVISPDVTRASS